MARADPDGRRRVCVVPLHDEVAVGTLAGLLRQAGLSKEELLRVL
jgi:predicted RNA binding protein YcfA (HicA-like mRNA interferase family)